MSGSKQLSVAIGFYTNLKLAENGPERPLCSSLMSAF
jgi:hypothetical protein